MSTHVPIALGDELHFGRTDPENEIAQFKRSWTAHVIGPAVYRHLG